MLQTPVVAKDEYFSQLSECGFAIMGHIRQQAFANLIALFYFGTKVFLRQKNPLLKTFRDWGLRVFCVESDLNRKSLELPLSDADQQHNRSIILHRLNEQEMEVCYRDLILGNRFDYEK
jgi:hypothetical protein